MDKPNLKVVEAKPRNYKPMAMAITREPLLSPQSIAKEKNDAA